MIARYSTYGSALIERAELFATAAHSAVGQTRHNGEPYIKHPREVAEIVAQVPGHTWRQVVAAWLHDVVEDTDITLRMMQDLFGPLIADDLKWLTNVEKSAGNRAARHKMNVERLGRTPPHVATVKVADIYCNTRDADDLDPSFRFKFLTEKVAAMDVLRHADAVLWNLTWELIHTKLKETADAQEA